MYSFLFRTFFARMDPERAHHLVMPVIRTLGVWPFAPVVRALTLAQAGTPARMPALPASPFARSAGALHA